MSTPTTDIPARAGNITSVPAPLLPGTEERKGLTKKEIAADHPTWCPGCGDFSVLARAGMAVVGVLMCKLR